MGHIISVSNSLSLFALTVPERYHCARVKLTMSLNRYFQYISVYDEWKMRGPRSRTLSVVGARCRRWLV